MLKLKAKLIKVDYEKIAIRLLPDLFKNVTEDSKMSTKIANELLVKNKVTNGIAKGLIKIIPQKTMASVSFDLITHNLDKITESINKYFEGNYIALVILDMKIQESSNSEYEMLIVEITLKEIDYNLLIGNILPKLFLAISGTDDKTGKLAQLLLGMEEVPNKMLTAALDVLPQGAKNELLTKMFSIYRIDILKYMNKLVNQQQISAVVSNIKVESL
ncbi:MAG: hypothetical protein K0S01_192 [Herbinix sp.]|jgi:hypothetical protein|nr:hypothetical protein [Herbinix sp.]